MNKIEKALMHGLFVHLHHNIDKVIDFKMFKELNEQVSQTWPGALLVGPDANDDAAVFRMPGLDGLFVGKMESHCSPCVPRPYDAAATGAGGAMRDVVAMGARPVFLLDFVGTRPVDQDVIVGPCGFAGECTCGNCRVMKSGERLNLMITGIRDMCAKMDVFVIGGGFSSSFSDIVPAVVVAVFGKLVTEAPLTKPAKKAGDKIILIGQTAKDGNDTLYRAGLVDVMRPAEALFGEEKTAMEAALAVFAQGKVHACSDLGAAGIGAAVCESARFGGFGARVDLSRVPVKEADITPEEILICETQARYIVQVDAADADAVVAEARTKTQHATIIGEITDDDKEIFEYGDKTVAVIPNRPSEAIMSSLQT